MGCLGAMCRPASLSDRSVVESCLGLLAATQLGLAGSNSLTEALDKILGSELHSWGGINHVKLG